MAQQTAVEWLMRQSFGEDFRMKVNDHQLNLFQQAIEMEEEQRFKFFIAGQLSMEEGGKDFEQYNNKFNNN